MLQKKKKTPCEKESFGLEVESVESVENARPVRRRGRSRCRRVAVIVAAAMEPTVEQQYHKGDNKPRCQRQLVVLVQHSVQQQ